MHMVDRRGCLDTRISQFECRAVTLVDMAYGADVMINPGRLDHFYLIQIPLSGGARVVMNGEEFECRPGMATVQDPDVPLQMYWGKGCRKLVLRFDRARFERFAELNHGKTFPRTIPMMPMLDLTQPEGLALSGLIQAVSTFPAAQTIVPAMITSHWELCLMSALFMMRAGSDASDHGPGEYRGPPQAVRRVRDYIEAHAQEDIDIADICKVAGVPLRTLHHQFRHSLGITPLQLLRDIRLKRVRMDLLGARAGSSVTSIALDWGFDHLGRFAASYKKRFGETPRETLKRTRVH